MKLLMVNDEVPTVQAMLERMDWMEYGIDEVYPAYNADEAKEILLEKPVDVVLCDIEMPGENGIALIRWIRERNMDLECLFFTCHANFDYAKEAVKLGCQDYILMPAKYEEIGNSVYKIVQRRLETMEEAKLQEYGKQWLSLQKKEAMDAQGEKRTPTEIVEMTCRFILSQLENAELTVNDAANHCYLNPIYLNRLFKKEKGMSISQYIINERMILAGKLLEETGLNAYTVAQKVGYANYPHFNTSFRKHYGCAPSQYKKNKEV